ncbi:bifunctional heptose 7-phosphate kinase/heptose 1-phosphate adenyltransferase [uncultured Fluviicola sp.]|uniref:bifunctional heptose 7-phosphate kinase/heptose 1-phosphate adenyltransferase n=1 Tax=uncultured Fluviicola sp. TaxID=463303 RepID=UPI0025ED67B9|nr:bifunctional ADP-heptose synthase [uncultured Fluviicola sp.]
MTIHEILAAFKTKRILVVGDVMIDAYMLGKVHRISPEAPVPIISLGKEEQRLGGAANVALNLQSLGANPIICSVVGSDQKGHDLTGLLTGLDMSADGILKSSERVTTVKTRVIGNNQHLLRIDAEDTHPLSRVEEDHFLEKIRAVLDRETIDAIIFEDYNKGVLTPKVISEVVKWAAEKQIPTTVDPKKENFLAYKGVTLFKPNLKELKEGIGIDCSFQQRDLFNQAVAELEKALENEITFVTLSEHGVFIKKDEADYHTPAHFRNIADVSGAGDTVISVATLCLTAELSIESIAELSNLAGGLVCEKSGVVSIDPDQLIQECEGKQYN